MQPGEVRIQVLSDHEKLRDAMVRLEQMSRAVVAGGKASSSWTSLHVTCAGRTATWHPS